MRRALEALRSELSISLVVPTRPGDHGQDIAAASDAQGLAKYRRSRNAEVFRHPGRLDCRPRGCGGREGSRGRLHGGRLLPMALESAWGALALSGREMGVAARGRPIAGSRTLIGQTSIVVGMSRSRTRRLIHGCLLSVASRQKGVSPHHFPAGPPVFPSECPFPRLAQVLFRLLSCFLLTLDQYRDFDQTTLFSCGNCGFGIFMPTVVGTDEFYQELSGAGLGSYYSGNLGASPGPQ